MINFSEEKSIFPLETFKFQYIWGNLCKFSDCFFFFLAWIFFLEFFSWVSIFLSFGAPWVFFGCAQEKPDLTPPPPCLPSNVLEKPCPSVIQVMYVIPSKLVLALLCSIYFLLAKPSEYVHISLKCVLENGTLLLWTIAEKLKLQKHNSNKIC